MPDGLKPRPNDGVTYPFYSTGGPSGPDGNKVDAEGNLYQTLMYQGRAIILNKFGVPVANVVIPGREEGKHLATSNLALKPGTDMAYILAAGEGGAWIYTFKALAPALTLYSHQ
jgi:lactonase